MGLFRRKTSDPDERAALIAEVEMLRQRLDEADLQKERLHAKLHVVAETNMAIDERVRTLDHAQEQLDVRIGSLDEARAALDDRVGMISSTSADLQERVGFIGSLSYKVQELSERLTTTPPAVPPPPPPVHEDPRVDELTERLAGIETKHAQIDQLNAAVAALASASEADEADTADEMLAALADRLDEVAATLAEQRDELTAAQSRLAGVDTMRTEMSQMADRLSGLDSRMRSISFELTNQLTELSNDLEKLLDRSDVDTGPAVDPDQLQLSLSMQVDEKVGQAMGAIQQSTERLAAEQARYEIKFREDLAQLAEQLRRPVLR